MDDAGRPACVQRHVQRRNHEVRCHRLTHGPAHDLAAEGIEHHGQVQKPRPRRDVGHVGHPQHVGRIGTELAIDQIGRRTLARIALGGHREAAPAADTFQTRLAHQTCYTLAARDATVAAQLGAHARHAIGGVGGVMHAPDLLGEHRISDRAGAGRATLPVIVAAVRDTQHAAHRARAQGVVGVGLVPAHKLVDAVDVFSLLPANQAVAFARMSRSCCSRLFSRRSRTSSSCSALLKPALPASGLPRSRASCATQLAMLCALGPNQISARATAIAALCHCCSRWIIRHSASLYACLA